MALRFDSINTELPLKIFWKRMGIALAKQKKVYFFGNHHLWYMYMYYYYYYYEIITHVKWNKPNKDYG